MIVRSHVIERECGLIFPQPGQGDWAPSGASSAVTQTNSETSARVPRKSFLFFLRDGLPGIGSAGDRDVVPAKHRGSCGVSVRSRLALENPREAI